MKYTEAFFVEHLKNKTLSNIDFDAIDENGFLPSTYAAAHGLLEVLATILDKDKKYYLQRDKNGDTPLVAAAKNSHLILSDYILKNMPKETEAEQNTFESEVNQKDITLHATTPQMKRLMQQYRFFKAISQDQISGVKSTDHFAQRNTM